MTVLATELRRASEDGNMMEVYNLYAKSRLMSNLYSELLIAVKEDDCNKIEELMMENDLNPRNAILEAAMYGHDKSVDIFLRDKRVYNRDILFTAACCGYTTIVKRIMGCPSTHIDFNRQLYLIIIYSAPKYGLLGDEFPLNRVYVNSDAIELLISDPRVDPSEDDNGPLKAAIELPHNDAIQLLLKDERVWYASLPKHNKIDEVLNNNILTLLLVLKRLKIYRFSSIALDIRQIYF